MISRVSGIAEPLGLAVNLLLGEGEEAFGADAFSAPPLAPLVTHEAKLPHTAESMWQPLTATLHTSVASVLHRLMPCSLTVHRPDELPVELVQGITGLSQRRQRQDQASALLRVPLAGAPPYLLLERARHDGTARYSGVTRPGGWDPKRWRSPEARGVTRDWRAVMARLRPGQRIRDETWHDATIEPVPAQAYLDAFGEVGTHYIAAATLGERLVQLVCLTPEAAAGCAGLFGALGNHGVVSGAETRLLSPYLGSSYTRAVGPVVSLAGDETLARLISDGLLADAHTRAGSSLLRSLDHDWPVTAATLSGVVPIHFELKSLAAFLPFYRAVLFDRILKGAMLQRWGDSVRCRVCEPPRVAAADRAASAAASSGPVGARLDIGKPLPANHAASCHEFVRMRAGGTSSFPPGIRLVQHVAAPTSSAEAAILTGPAEGDPPIVCQTMSGVVILASPDGTGRRVVVDGLRFRLTHESTVEGSVKVEIDGDLHTLSPARAVSAMPAIHAALARCAACLAGGADTASAARAVSLAAWLSDLLPTQDETAALRACRLQALYLARLACPPVPQGVLSPLTAGEHLPRMAASAIAADEWLRAYDAGQASRAGVWSALSAICRETAGRLAQVLLIAEDTVRVRAHHAGRSLFVPTAYPSTDNPSGSEIIVGESQAHWRESLDWLARFEAAAIDAFAGQLQDYTLQAFPTAPPFPPSDSEGWRSGSTGCVEDGFDRACYAELLPRTALAAIRLQYWWLGQCNPASQVDMAATCTSIETLRFLLLAMLRSSNRLIGRADDVTAGRLPIEALSPGAVGQQILTAVRSHNGPASAAVTPIPERGYQHAAQ